MRALASIVTVKTIEKMLNKDRIVCVTFEENGYEAIVPSSVKKGDLLLFIQEGAILPVGQQWEFLRKRCFKEDLNGFLIKPMTMGQKEDGTKVKSWGLAITPGEVEIDENIESGKDFTDFLKIRKYDPDSIESMTSSTKKKIPLWVKFCAKYVLLRWVANIYFITHKVSKLVFPSEYIEKSDETSIQNCKKYLEENVKVYTSIKIEGQSVTAMLNPKKLKELIVCSRSIAYSEKTKNTFTDTAKELKIKEKLSALYKKTRLIYIIQCEQVGPSIQNNIYNLPKVKWLLYTAKTYNPKTKETKQLSLEEMKRLSWDLSVEMVPIIDENIDLHSIMKTVKGAEAYAEKCVWVKEEYKIKSCIVKNLDNLWKSYMQHEGVVVRTMDYDKSKNIGFSFKIKNMQYQEDKTLPQMAKLSPTVKFFSNEEIEKKLAGCF